MQTNDETNNANEHNMVNDPNWQEADQLTIYHYHLAISMVKCVVQVK